MRHFTLLITIAGLLCMGLQCNNDNDDPNPKNGNGTDKEQLPPATHSGENTFGCKVNGEVWVPEAPPNFNELHADYYQDEFFISARKYKEGDFTSSIHLDIDSGFNGKGTYTLMGKNNESFGIYDLKTVCDFETDSINTGELKITHFDSSQRIVSGTFRFTVESQDCNPNSIKITKGRFDIQD